MLCNAWAVRPEYYVFLINFGQHMTWGLVNGESVYDWHRVTN